MIIDVTVNKILNNAEIKKIRIEIDFAYIDWRTLIANSVFIETEDIDEELL